MAMAYKTPGVYVKELQSFPPSVAEVETAIPAFIGYTQRAEDAVADDLILAPTRISSMVEYEKYFGVADPEKTIAVTITTATDGSFKSTATLPDSTRSKHLMYYALQMFFANGGGPCYIVSVAKYKTLDPVDLTAGLTALAREDEPTLIVFPEAQNLAIAQYAPLMNAALQQCADLQDRFVIMDVHGGSISMSEPESDTDLATAFANFRNCTFDLDKLKYGAAYAPNIETVLTFQYDEGSTNVTVDSNAAAALSTLKTSNTQIYALATAAISNMGCILPPSSAIAGIYAATDSSRGVWKAPANVAVSGVIQPTIQITNAEQDGMNVDPTSGKSINAIRTFLGKGTLVWGARTLAGNDNDWRYVNVRRFFIFAEESIQKATQQFVFEANDSNTWVRVQGMIENFLTTLWRDGALQGTKPEQAFYVAVGLGKTMTALDILEGRLNVTVGMAPVHPAEFIVLTFSQLMAQS
jgi:phage tail sheath protein FI